ncbi:MAG: hypothetical protein Tsb009_17820 [Planctomycetaceae bacterium]
MLGRFLTNYVARHRNRANQIFHIIGVPLTFVVSVIFLVQHRWWWALGCFVGGYVLQFIGHAIEGNDAGEVVLVKKILGKPYVEFGPDAPESQSSADPPD